MAAVKELQPPTTPSALGLGKVGHLEDGAAAAKIVERTTTLTSSQKIEKVSSKLATSLTVTLAEPVHGEMSALVLPVVEYNRANFIETAKGNKISRECVLSGSQNIILQGKTVIKKRAILRGDLAQIRIGRYCTIGELCVIRPAYKALQRGFAFYPMQIGANVIIGKNSVIQAACIGCNVRIGEGCVVSRRSILKDCCLLLDGSVLAPDTVMPPFSIFGGSPAKIVGELPICTPELISALCFETFSKFRAKSDPA